MEKNDQNKARKMIKPTKWDEKVEEAYRFQLAGFDDEQDYKQFHKVKEVDRWPKNGYVKKLQLREGQFYYYDEIRLCADRHLKNVRVYLDEENQEMGNIVPTEVSQEKMEKKVSEAVSLE